MATTTIVRSQPPPTRPPGQLHIAYKPIIVADNSQTWRATTVKDRHASRSYSVSQSTEIARFSSRTSEHPWPPYQHAPGTSPLERLPTEILQGIIDMVAMKEPALGGGSQQYSIQSLLNTSRILYSVAVRARYEHVAIHDSKVFRKLLFALRGNPGFGTLVRRIDFSPFNPIVLFSSAKERLSADNPTPKTLIQCLNLAPRLREFVAQEHIDDEIDVMVLTKLFCHRPHLTAADFCGCSSLRFRTAMTTFTKSITDKNITFSVSRLSLHRCDNLPPVVFDQLLHRMNALTHLDLAGTKVSAQALQSIPHSARITHLNLSRCNGLTASAILEFLQSHPSVKDSLVVLNLAVDFRTRCGFRENDVSQLLISLPRSLRSLNLKGSEMGLAHIPLLRGLMMHLHELALGRGLTVADLERLFVADSRLFDQDEDAQCCATPPAAILSHTLRYLDLSDYVGQELDLGALFSSECSIMQSRSAPLSVVEVAGEFFRGLSRSPIPIRVGWTDFSWKTGTGNWGMRKIPVVVGEVCAMYRNYTFMRSV
ncbi:uncharacterized protein B0I36DRAFT_378271 [Microdochium trichocladiopsis]|uniref:F-box domain-containing protein n=1 Tax=Microdochium trichocladiopsis TaxID=1682393 RepID=A0A9P8XQU9_9PEZI|nr:uncharacterized protein B0I36DRAFT_378271 [Microdochium trichocladiopsis]KAH7012447.1 hypothetical protein B0I36DRAFT_378271 [Microdochium trichocladiopsis]